MPKLVFLNGDCAGRVCELDDGQITVGRNESSMILLGDLTVSRKHCELLIYCPEVIVHDLGSASGTLVQDRMLNGSQCQALSGGNDSRPLSVVNAVAVPAR
jgi:pSer/pThr/pTyr-binding forkhead associated (FHA) protein